MPRVRSVNSQGRVTAPAGSALLGLGVTSGRSAVTASAAAVAAVSEPDRADTNAAHALVGVGGRPLSRNASGASEARTAPPAPVANPPVGSLWSNQDVADPQRTASLGLGSTGTTCVTAPRAVVLRWFGYRSPR